MESKLDSRLQRTRITHPVFPLERTFCAYCGAPKGWVTYDSGDFIDAASVVVVCDDCAVTYADEIAKNFNEVPLQEYPLK